MIYNKDCLVSLSTIAKDRGILKSRLLYYVQLGILQPMGKHGKTLLFDGQTVVKILDNIDCFSQKGVGLKEFKIRILPTL